MSFPGKGRGVITAADVSPGEMLMCCNPLGVITGETNTQHVASSARDHQSKLSLTCFDYASLLHTDSRCPALSMSRIMVLETLCLLLSLICSRVCVCAVSAGPQHVRLSVEQLQQHLASHYNNTAHHWLYQLYDGSEGSTAAAVAFHPQQQHHAQQLRRCHQRNGSDSWDNSSRTPAGDHSVPLTDATLQRLMDVVRYNAYGDLHDDLAAAALAGEAPAAVIGLWPEFSMFNHSCVPNAINWVLPGVSRAMVVRAARNIPAGADRRGQHW